MYVYIDCFGRNLRLTEERLAHLLCHPELPPLKDEIPHVLKRPTLVRRSQSDAAVRLFYRYYEETVAGGKWLCVVAKYLEEDAFVITAYLTDKPKQGEELWRTP